MGLVCLDDDTDHEGKVTTASSTIGFDGRFVDCIGKGAKHVSPMSLKEWSPPPELVQQCDSDIAENGGSKTLGIFSSDGVKPQKTSDGRVYVTELISHAESKLVIAHYHIDPIAEKPAECRERMFVVSDDGRKVFPVSKTLDSCEIH